MNEWETYARGVTDGSIVAGRLIRVACERFLADLDDERFEFRAETVERAIKYIALLRHFTGKADGKSFVLEPWQSFIVANIVGFYWAGTDSRRFTSSYIEVARKNGKTVLASALCLYFLTADGEGGAEVLLCANSKDQARIAFDMCRNYAGTLDPKGSMLRCYRSEILVDKTRSRLKVLAADDSKLDGFNCSFGLVDEYHAAPNSRVRDVIKSSQGMRENPHLCTITTAGFDKNGPCYQLRTTAVEILEGLKEDDEMFVAIFCMDDDDDWTDEDVWIKANPNLGVTVTAKYIRGQVQQAKNNSSEEVSTVTKNLNRWMDTQDVWIPERYIAQGMVQELPPLDGVPCYVGVDLGSTSDLTAVAKLWCAGGFYWFDVSYYLPEAVLVERTGVDMYRRCRRNGELKVTPGNVTDYDIITNDLMGLSNNFVIHCVCYDKWNAIQWAIDATEKGLPLQEYSQTIGNFNKPTREFERLLLSGKVKMLNNELTRFCLRNVVLKYDHNGNCKPNKGLERKKIDGVIAMLMALGGYLETPHWSNEIF